MDYTSANGGGTIIEKIKQVFSGELHIGNIRKLASFEYELDTMGYNYIYSGWKLPMSTFDLMMDYGLSNIRIMNSRKVKDSYCITMRFLVNEEKLNERLEEDKRWRERWEQLQKERESKND